MSTAVFMNGKKFTENDFNKEENLENIVKNNYKMLFGSKTIYIDIKNKVDTKSLGSSIPDGALFDFADKDNPEFYLIEVELEKHSFYNHIFPQLTKFFAFFKNSISRNNLIEKLFDFIKSNNDIKEEFKKYLGEEEIYKTIKDTIENSQNILLIFDKEKEEIKEITDTYTDTWGKIVIIGILKRFVNENNVIYTLTPDFEVGIISDISEEDIENKYSELYHLDGVEEKIKLVYNKIKEQLSTISPNIMVNPQRYYISLRERKNFIYVEVRKKKIQIVIMLPYETGNELIKYHKIKELSQGVQNFYNGPCFKVNIEDDNNLEEIINIIKQAYERQKE